MNCNIFILLVLDFRCASCYAHFLSGRTNPHATVFLIILIPLYVYLRQNQANQLWLLACKQFCLTQINPIALFWLLCLFFKEFFSFLFQALVASFIFLIRPCMIVAILTLFLQIKVQLAFCFDLLHWVVS